ncbi:ABC transporter permease [Actinotalea sp. K2]|uniref:ABC transporter permease n=1 Tax=Actinotalea sp. K2 TaxID=2939438 RepID=UPI0020172F3B|nr:ABC transporter permease [Actinotalea sp. K2]MCL3860267.1 ABC transporter permease [Actinotalea sp. K2]
MTTTTRTGRTRLPRGRARHPGVVPVVSVAVLTFVAVAALQPALLTSGDPTAIQLARALQPPSFAHLLGTDQSGRDLYTRIVYGARESLTIGLGATALAMGIAVLLGFLAGLGGRVVDRLVGAALEVTFAFPVMLLALLLVAVRGPSSTTLIIAVGVGSAPGYARMVRGQVLAVRQEAYVEAACALGHGRARVVAQHVFPNAVRPLLALFTLGIGQSIVWASGLAFLGMGVAPPAAEWGALLEAGRMYITHAWWLEVMPGLAIVLVAVAATSLGRTLQKSLEGADR